MLESFDLSLSIKKDEYSNIIDPLKAHIGELQRDARVHGKAVIIAVEGWRGSGISRVINRLIHALDPRGVRVIPIGNPSDIEREHHMMWRFWVSLPPYGQIIILDRSWYSRTLVERFSPADMDSVPAYAIDDILTFEEQLTDDGNLLIKLFLHVSSQTQTERLEKVSEESLQKECPFTATPDCASHYQEYLPIIEHLISRTDTLYAPWTIIEAEHGRYAYVKVLQTVTSLMEAWLARLKTPLPEMIYAARLPPDIAHPGIHEDRSALDLVDLTLSYHYAEYKKLLHFWEERLSALQNDLIRQKKPVIIVFEGWDAAGKGGCIVRLTNSLNPRGYTVEPIGKPSDWDLLHHYLWRFYIRLPKKGHITIFDRSWYGRVLVERVEGLCREEEWKRAYHEINGMEERLSKNENIIIKFWLQIDKDEQLNRFRDREGDPEKQWKITDEDWRNREKWENYRSAVSEMLKRTSTPLAPWTIVPANDKYYARVTVLRTVAETIEKNKGIENNNKTQG
ncbi:MAG: polyphosphate:AMP phosphotransferase [Methanospirillaceae archaeon]|nr:polyphosphate:AMP phosphotransferase [Methanospirillaceae archaeon]